MPTGLRRYHNTGNLHFIGINCFRKRPIFDTPEPRNTFLTILEQTRLEYSVDIYGYVIMPTHIHLLISEPKEKPLASFIQVIKQRFSKTRIEKEVWELRYYDFNVFTSRKITEKLDYMHMNPVKAGLAIAPPDWQWSSYRTIYHAEPGPVKITID